MQNRHMTVMCAQLPFFLQKIDCAVGKIGENTSFSNPFQQKLDKAF